MSIDLYRTFLQRYIDAWNQKDLALLDSLTDEFMAVDFVWHMPSSPNFATGANGQKAFVRQTLESSPDFHITLNDLLSDGDKMVIRMTVQGNNPTTKAVETTAVLEIDRFVDGKIVECWSVDAPGSW